MKKPFGKLVLAWCQVILVIGFATWVADFRSGLDGNDTTSMVLLADDWAIYGDLIWGESRDAETKIWEIFSESWEARPLRAVEYALERWAFGLFGFHGGFYLQWIILTLSGSLFVMILRRRFSSSLALLGGLLLVLHPADTTHLWLATMMAKLGILYALIAIRLFLGERRKTAAFFLLAAFLSYELSPFIFVVAPFFAEGDRQKNLREAFLIFVGTFATYLSWRFFIYVEAVPDVRFAGGGIGPFGWTLYAQTYLTTIRDLLWRTTFDTSLLPQWQMLMGLLGIATLCGALAIKFARADEVQKNHFRLGFLWALLALLAGSCLSFRASPNADLGIASRHNIAAIIGAALFFVCLIDGCSHLLPRPWGRGVALGFGVFLILVFTLERQQIQKSYQDAGNFQRRVLQEALTTIGPVPPHTLIVFGSPLASWPKKKSAMDPFVTGHAYEIESICELVYDKSVVGFCLENPNDLLRGKTSTAHAISQESPPFHSIVYYDCKQKTVQWVKRPPIDEDEKKIRPHGPAWHYILGT